LFWFAALGGGAALFPALPAGWAIAAAPVNNKAPIAAAIVCVRDISDLARFCIAIITELGKFKLALGDEKYLSHGSRQWQING
jgi:hypothetical protein